MRGGKPGDFLGHLGLAFPSHGRVLSNLPKLFAKLLCMCIFLGRGPTHFTGSSPDSVRTETTGRDSGVGRVAGWQRRLHLFWVYSL